MINAITGGTSATQRNNRQTNANSGPSVVDQLLQQGFQSLQQSGASQTTPTAAGVDILAQLGISQFGQVNGFNAPSLISELFKNLLQQSGQNQLNGPNGLSGSLASAVTPQNALALAQNIAGDYLQNYGYTASGNPLKQQ